MCVCLSVCLSVCRMHWILDTCTFKEYVSAYGLFWLRILRTHYCYYYYIPSYRPMENTFSKKTREMSLGHGMGYKSALKTKQEACGCKPKTCCCLFCFRCCTIYNKTPRKWGRLFRHRYQFRIPLVCFKCWIVTITKQKIKSKMGSII